MNSIETHWISGMQTDIGRNPMRVTNEDNVGSYYPLSAAQLALRGALYVVVDGIGGENAGEVAAETALNTTIETYARAPRAMDNARALCQAIAEANQAVLQRSIANAGERGMGTTIVAAVVQADGQLILANVGDSRCYLVREGRVQQLSVDHTWVAEQVAAGRLGPEEVRTHRRRHQIVRSLGKYPVVEVEHSNHQLLPGDVVVLCSDGLSDVTEDEEIGELAAQGDPQSAADSLVNLANARGGPDNIAVAVIHYGQREVVPSTLRAAR